MKYLKKSSTVTILFTIITIIYFLTEPSDTSIDSLSGIKFDKIEIYSYHTKRAWNGDGYSIQIFEINEKTIKQFLDSKKNFLNPHLKLYDDRENWNKKNWKRSPLPKNEMIYSEFALTGLAKQNSVIYGRNENIETFINTILNEKGNYYAYFYSLQSEGNVGNIDFFIISPNRRLLIVINNNT